MDLPVVSRFYNPVSDHVIDVLLEKVIEKGIRRRGFSVVEVMSNCHIQYGRRNRLADPVTMMNWFKDHAVPMEKSLKMKPEDLQDKFTVGVLTDVEKPVYTEEYQKIRKKAEKALKSALSTAREFMSMWGQKTVPLMRMSVQSWKRKSNDLAMITAF